MKFLPKSIKSKLVLVNIALLICIISVFYYVNFYYSNKIIVSLLQESLDHLSNATKNSLELALQSERKDNLNFLLENISSEPEIDQIFIAGTDNLIKFSSRDSSIGEYFAFGEESEGQVSTDKSSSGNLIVLKSDNRGKEFYRHINPILKKPQCESCHVSNEPVLGNLVIDFSSSVIARHQSSLRWVLIILIFATSIILIVLGNIIIQRFVLNKLTTISSTINAITQGNIDRRINVNGNDEIDSVANNFNEMIERVNVLLGEIQEDKLYLENLINSIDDGILVVNMDYTIALANKAILEKTGLSLESIVGKYCYQVKSGQNIPCKAGDLHCPLEEIRKSGKPVKTLHTSHPHENGSDGEKRFLEIYASPMKNEQGEVEYIIEVIRDITERKKLEGQLIQSEKLASIGVLTTNVAHEINNPMASITTCVEGLLKRMTKIQFKDSAVESVFKEYLTTIKNAAFRCKNYTEKLLSFSTPSQFDFVDFNVNDSLRDVTALVEHQALKYGKTIKLDLGSDLPYVRGDKTQLSQVFLNLITNGLDATGENGTVTVRSERNSSELRISIQDNGCGIDKNIRDKIFEPFFTTKEKGKGTGLGLYIAKNVVEKHGGRIDFEDISPHGTRFTVYIPSRNYL